MGKTQIFKCICPGECLGMPLFLDNRISITLVLSLFIDKPKIILNYFKIFMIKLLARSLINEVVSSLYSDTLVSIPQMVTPCPDGLVDC